MPGVFSGAMTATPNTPRMLSTPTNATSAATMAVAIPPVHMRPAATDGRWFGRAIHGWYWFSVTENSSRRLRISKFMAKRATAHVDMRRSFQ
ncbi:hypothetical protein GCM10027436_73340 [Actinophytocola sediminis]